MSVSSNLIVNGPDAIEVERLEGEIKSIQAVYRQRGNPMAGLEFDLSMELRARGWKLKGLCMLVGAARSFFEDAGVLATMGRMAQEKISKLTGLEKFFSAPARDRSMYYRMSTLALAFGCEAYINEYGTHRLGADEFESFDRLSLDDKWIVVPKVVTGKTFDKSREPYQTLRRLTKTRNDWVHHKPSEIFTRFGKTGGISEAGRRPIKIPEDYAEVANQIKRVLELINTLHQFDGSQTLLS